MSLNDYYLIKVICEVIMHKFPVGAIVYVPFLGVLKHVGVISDKTINGEPTVISASQKTSMVKEETFEDFSEGKPVELTGISGSLTGMEVVRRARSKVGVKYQLFSLNCEHFARWCHGLKVESKQLQFFVVLASIAIVALIVKKNKIV